MLQEKRGFLHYHQEWCFEDIYALIHDRHHWQDLWNAYLVVLPIFVWPDFFSGETRPLKVKMTLIEHMLVSCLMAYVDNILWLSTFLRINSSYTSVASSWNCKLLSLDSFCRAAVLCAGTPSAASIVQKKWD